MKQVLTLNLYIFSLTSKFQHLRFFQVAALAMEDMIDWMHGGGQVSWFLLHSLLQM